MYEGENSRKDTLVCVCVSGKSVDYVGLAGIPLYN